MELIKRLIKDEAGQGLTEYALIIGLIALVVVGAVGLLGDQIKTIFTNIKNELMPVAEGPAGQ